MLKVDAECFALLHYLNDTNSGRGCMVWDLSYSCDICGQKKGEASHWWMVVLEDQHCHEDGQTGKGFILLPWNRDECRSGQYYHLCGQNCAMQAMERFMTSGAIALETA